MLRSMLFDRWRAFALLAAGFVLLFSASCSGDNDSDAGADAGNEGDSSAQTSDDTPAPTVESNVPAHSAGTRVDDDALDSILDALESGSVEDLVAQMRFESLACSTDGGDAPRCPSGVADGTTVEALPGLQCDQPSFVIREGIERSLSGLERGRYVLYAAYTQPDTTMPGDTALLLVHRVEGFPLVLNAEAGTVVGITSPCEETPDEVIAAAGVTDFLLAPPESS